MELKLVILETAGLLLSFYNKPKILLYSFMKQHLKQINNKKQYQNSIQHFTKLYKRIYIFNFSGLISKS